MTTEQYTTLSEEITTISPEAGQPALGQTGLTIQDLSLVLQVINLTASRGAYKADELTTVGGLHDRIYKFLDSVGAIAKNAAAASDAPQAPTSSTE